MVMDLRVGGANYRQIAAEVSKVTPARDLPKHWNERYAWKDLVRRLDEVRKETDETADHVLQLEIKSCDAMIDALWPSVTRVCEKPIEHSVEQGLAIVFSNRDTAADEVHRFLKDAEFSVLDGKSSGNGVRRNKRLK